MQASPNFVFFYLVKIMNNKSTLKKKKNIITVLANSDVVSVSWFNIIE